jgi:Protein phosphatase 2C
MILERWCYAAASVIGTSHLKLGTCCQDANECQLLNLPEGDEVFVAVLSDGAGSAEHSQEGSNLTCSVLMGHVIDHISGGNAVSQITRDVASAWLLNVQGQIAAHAESMGWNVRDYASTVIAAVIGGSAAAFLQVGDGAIVVSEEIDAYGHVFWPDRGEYENTTYFITQDSALEHLQFENIERTIQEVAVFTDGIQRLALDYKAEMPHQPFFQSMFSALRREGIGRQETLCDSLRQFLGSERVNGRTDDDKTLVIASRFHAKSRIEQQNDDPNQ